MEYITTAQGAEENAAGVLRDLGYADAIVTPVGPDGGVDVIASNALAQVKWQGAVVGRPELQQLFGSRGADMDKRLFFFAAAGYSAAAVEYANAAAIAIFTYDPLGKVTAVNDHALEQLRTGDANADAIRHSLSLPRANVLRSYFWEQLYYDPRGDDHKQQYELVNKTYELVESPTGSIRMEPFDASLESYVFVHVCDGIGPTNGMGVWVLESELSADSGPSIYELKFTEILVSRYRLQQSQIMKLHYKAALLAADVVSQLKELEPDMDGYLLSLENGTVWVSGKPDLQFEVTA